jgi:glycosyltransferase involved in cell wall biosynthesis
MTRVAETRNVLFVNSIGMRMPLPGRSTMFLRRIARKAASVARLLRRPLPGVPRFSVMTPLVLPLYGTGWARRVNAKLVRAQVTLVARYLGMRSPVVVVTIPTALEVVRGMPRSALIYNRSDKHSAYGEADQAYIEELERALLVEADIVLYVSRTLMAEESHLAGERAHFLDHGVALEHFRRRDPGEEPADLRVIPHPRLGFFGGLDEYLVDFDLIEHVAREIPEAQVVLIGDADCSMQRFEGIPNVHWLGFRPYEDIPRYGSGFDVALMPWLDNEWIRHSNPIKLKEYLALGLPVVSTELPEARAYEGLVRFASDRRAFVAALREVLAELAQGVPTPTDARPGLATWREKARELVNLAENLAGRPPNA